MGGCGPVRAEGPGSNSVREAYAARVSCVRPGRGLSKVAEAHLEVATEHKHLALTV